MIGAEEGKGLGLWATERRAPGAYAAAAGVLGWGGRRRVDGWILTHGLQLSFLLQRRRHRIPYAARRRSDVAWAGSEHACDVSWADAFICMAVHVRVD